MILVADDNDDVRNILHDSLNHFGYEVVLAVDGQDAVEKFKAHADSIKLVLLDVVMPKMNGIKAYLEIKQIRSDIKVLLLSGYATDVIEGSPGLDEKMELIMKPFNPIELEQRIRDILDGNGGGCCKTQAGGLPGGCDHAKENC